MVCHQTGHKIDQAMSISHVKAIRPKKWDFFIDEFFWWQKYKVLLISNWFKIGDSIFKSIKKNYKNSIISEKKIFLRIEMFKIEKNCHF